MSDRLSPQQTTSQGNNPSENSTTPTIDYWHVWTDREGVSHQSRRQIQDFKLKSIAPPASPQWIGQLKQEGATIFFTVLPSRGRRILLEELESRGIK